MRHLQVELERQEAALNTVSEQYSEWAASSGEVEKQARVNDLISGFGFDEFEEEEYEDEEEGEEVNLFA